MKEPLSPNDIYQVLKEAIVNLTYMPSEKLSENKIAAEFHVSRTPVKAAFTRLENEGYLTVLPQRGTFVSQLDLSRIREILYMRFVLEKDIVIQFITKVSEDDIQELQDILLTQRELITRDNFTPSEFYELDVLFHGIVFEKVGHSILWEELLKLQVNYVRFRMLDIVSTEKFSDLILEHSMLLEAIIKKDSNQYINILEEHLQGNLQKLENIMKSNLQKYFSGGNK